MPLNSVNTNMGAMIALQSLNNTNTQLQATQKRISTGYRVADATDDGAAYAVAQNLRADVAGLTSANQQLNASAGLLNTTIKGLQSISSEMSLAQAVLVKLSDSSISSDQRTQYQNELKQFAVNIKNNIQDSIYQGKSLIDSYLSSANGFTNVNITRNEQGALYALATYNASAIFANLSGLAASTMTAGSIATALANSNGTVGSFVTQRNNIGTYLNKYGNNSQYISSQVTFNNNRIDAINSGLGALVDADLSKEAANLQALQTRQQLGTQALSLANQAPNSLLSLFR